MVVVSNGRAVRASVEALRELGRVEPVDEAIVAAAVALADAVDDMPEDARLWGQYQAALRALRALSGSSDADAFARLLGEVSER